MLWLPLIEAVYIVQTIDNKLHFISENEVDTHPIPFLYPNKPTTTLLEYHPPSDNLVCPAAVPPDYGEKDHSEQSGSSLHNKYPLPRKIFESTDSNEEKGIAKSMRIDSIFVTRNGYVAYDGYRISLNDLYHLPFLKDGVYISATREYCPSFINQIFILCSSVTVKILDLKQGHKKKIRFSYITCLFESYKSFIIENNVIYINNKRFELSDTIMAVYESKCKDGLNYMVKLFNNTFLDVYLHENVNTGKSSIFRILLVLLALFLLINTVKRNLKYGKLLSKKAQIYEGKFVKKTVMIHVVDSASLSFNTSIQKQHKDTSLVNIYYEGRRFLHSVIASECTSQYPYQHAFSPEAQISIFKEISALYGRMIASFTYHFNLIRNFRKTPEQPDFEEKRNIQNSDHLKVINPCSDSADHTTEQREKYNRLKEDLLTFAQAVEKIHEKGIAHSRICPENLRISEHGNRKIQFIFNNYGWRSPTQLKNLKNKKYKPKPVDDIFSMGCVIHYFLTGYHPYDLRNCKKIEKRRSISIQDQQESKDSQTEFVPNLCSDEVNSEMEKYEIYKQILPEKYINYIENNILFKTYNIRLSDQIEHDLIYHSILNGNLTISKHPFFWSFKDKAEFISDFSDFIETNSHLKYKVEKIQHVVFRKSWVEYLDPLVVDHIGTKRLYDPHSLTGLIRLIRNLHRHYQECRIKYFFDKYEGKLCEYFLATFPDLFMVLYRNKDIKSSEIFQRYF